MILNVVKSKSSDGKDFKCKLFYKRYSIRTGSFFSNVHVSLRLLLLCTFLLSIEASVTLVSACFKKKLSTKKIIQMFDFLREVMSTYMVQNNAMLGGPNATVEIDETAIGRKRKFQRGAFRGSCIKWIFGLIDRNTKKCHLQYVQNRQRQTLFPIIERFVIPGTCINSHEFLTYRSLNQEGYINTVL